MLASEARKTARQAGRFGLVGIANTILDFAIFNALRVAGVGIVASNFVSTSICMGVSFVANRSFVFSAEEASSWKRQALLFFPGTAFGMYVLQPLTILFFLRVFTAPLGLVVAMAESLGNASDATHMLLRANGAKLAATAVSLTWNYAFYRRAVFAKPGASPAKEGPLDDFVSRDERVGD
jgi:putative flippase GtrA